MAETQRPSQRWWAEHGQQWYEECQRRRRTNPYFMMQEAFLSGYFGLAAPCRVLEFGCGFGRHLSYLRLIPGMEIFGCDQSPTMLAGAQQLLDKAWIDEHVKAIPAAGPLPYPDKSFDVVYTASVLIHIHPDDVLPVIRELLRLARWHILHIENPPTSETVVTCAEHDGCWAHPLPALYRELGVELEVLPPHGQEQYGYRALLEPGRRPPDVTALASRLHETDAHYRGICDSLRQQEQEFARQRHLLEESQRALAATMQQCAEQTVGEATFHQRLISTLNGKQNGN